MMEMVLRVMTTGDSAIQDEMADTSETNYQDCLRP